MYIKLSKQKPSFTFFSVVCLRVKKKFDFLFLNSRCFNHPLFPL